jgi:hypothetical protein
MRAALLALATVTSLVTASPLAPSSAAVTTTAPSLAGLAQVSSSSVNCGKTWSTAIQVGSPTLLSRIVPTSDGPFAGDYIGTAIASGRAFALFAIGLPATGHKQFNEPMVVVPGASRLPAARIPSSPPSSLPPKPAPFPSAPHLPQVSSTACPPLGMNGPYSWL